MVAAVSLAEGLESETRAIIVLKAVKTAMIAMLEGVVLLGMAYGALCLLSYLFRYWTGLIDKEEYVCLEVSRYGGYYDKVHDKKYKKNDGIYGHLYYVTTDSKCPPVLVIYTEPGKIMGHLRILFNARGHEKIKGGLGEDFALTKAAYEELKSSFSPPEEVDEYLVSRIVDASEIKEPWYLMAPLALMFQKKGQWGHTDYNQRKEDMIECGIPRERYEDNIRYIDNVRTDEGETVEQYSTRQERFLQCMYAKDYDWLDLEECGPVKENRGICK